MLAQRATYSRIVAGVLRDTSGRRGGTYASALDGLADYTVTDAPARVTENLARIRFAVGLRRNRWLRRNKFTGSKYCRQPIKHPSMRWRRTLSVRRNKLEVGFMRTADCAYSSSPLNRPGLQPPLFRRVGAAPLPTLLGQPLRGLLRKWR